MIRPGMARQLQIAPQIAPQTAEKGAAPSMTLTIGLATRVQTHKSDPTLDLDRHCSLPDPG